jgi:hypothetical protein
MSVTRLQLINHIKGTKQDNPQQWIEAKIGQISFQVGEKRGNLHYSKQTVLHKSRPRKPSRQPVI